MASYKVPQDVEADDKLLGPFTFRQFIYLLIVVGLGFIAWGLAQLFIGLVIIPLPAMLLFGALAAPLRKDQPMEIYLAAIVSFYIKPRKRLWDPEGIESLIEIVAPKTVEVQLTKDLSQSEAEKRLSYLANIVDSGGWAIRGAGMPQSAAVNNDIYLEAQEATDVLDTNTAMAHNIDALMDQRTTQVRQEAMQHMLQATQPQVAPQQPAVQQVPVAPQTYATQPPPTPASYTQAPAYAPPAITAATPVVTPEPTAEELSLLPPTHFDPYPSFHQSVIQPLNDTTHQAEGDLAEAVPAPAPAPVVAPAPKSTPSTSETEFTAGIMNLANNSDYSIETMAHEANRLKKKAEEAEESDEVVISLR